MAKVGELAKTTNKPVVTASKFLGSDAVRNKVKSMIGGKEGEKFIASIVSAVATNPNLQECDGASILNCALLGHSLKLSPSPQLGLYYLVPFNVKTGRKDENGKEIYIQKAQFQLGYKGYIQLAIRSGKLKKLNTLEIKEGELILWNPLDEEIKVKLIDDARVREQAKTIGYFAMFETINGYVKRMYWSKEKMEAHASQYSKGYSAKKGFTFWEKDFDSMAKKTMLRQLSKWLPMEDEMKDLQEAVEKDQATINDDLSVNSYIDNDDTVEIIAPVESQRTPF